MSDYAAFLARKALRAPTVGIEAPSRLPKALKPFQRDIVLWALRRGRAAVFAGTGLGKTLMQLAWADAVEAHEGAPVLVLTPLAVAQQTVIEAEKFSIPGVEYAPDGKSITSRIVVTNYDRFERFDISRFAGIVADESSIIKAHDSATRKLLTEACRDVRFKLPCTATPAPNDWVELGTHAEFLGVMSEKEMLASFFVHDGSMRAHGDGEWRLKRHAMRAFWEWVASWAVLIRSPEDLGHAEPGYVLPPLERRQVTAAVEYRPTSYSLFPIAARTMAERISARRDSIQERCAAAAAIVNAQPDRPWLVWCNLNAEADLLVWLIAGAEQVKGSDDREDKTKRLLGFVNGSPPVLVTKPSIAAHGMNYQHCADMVFVGLNDSFEQLYQAVRRCWRFGQARPVTAYLIASELEGAVVANLQAKEAAFEKMGAAMAEHMRDLSRQAVRGRGASRTTRPAVTGMELPAWM